jgi:long-chain acyl-CoA synthetase
MLGAQEKTRISIISSTNLYWILIDLSIAKLKSITVPIHINTSKEDMLHIINNSNIQFIFIENKIDLEKIRKIKKNTINLKKTIFFYNNKFTERLKNEITLNQLISLGLNHQSESKSNFNKKNVILKNNIASIVYTSGTTGKSKGAIITHFNLIHTAKAIKKINFIKKNDIQLLFLPLSHIFAKILMIVWLTTNHKLCMVRNINKIINEMPKLKPTIMAAVPRIFEKIHYKIIDNMFSGTFMNSN